MTNGFKIGQMEGIIKKDRSHEMPSEVITKKKSRRDFGEVRNLIRDYVATHPGTRTRAIQAALGYSNVATASAAAHRVAKKGYIVRVRQDGAMRHYPKGYKLSLPLSPRQADRSGVSGRSLTIIDYMELHPSGVTLREVAGVIGTSPALANHYMKRLQKMGRVEPLGHNAKGKGGAYLWRITGGSVPEQPKVEEEVKTAPTQDRRKFEDRVKIRPTKLRRLAERFVYERVNTGMAEHLSAVKEFVAFVENEMGADRLDQE